MISQKHEGSMNSRAATADAEAAAGAGGGRETQCDATSPLPGWEVEASAAVSGLASVAAACSSVTASPAAGYPRDASDTPAAAPHTRPSACTVAASFGHTLGASSAINDGQQLLEQVKENLCSSRHLWTRWEEPLPPYLDNNSSTPVDPRALREMMPFLEGLFGNPGSSHVRGLINKAALVEARQRVARCLRCSPRCIYFTSGATECLNWVFKGVAQRQQRDGKKCHIVTTRIEHPAVKEICKNLLGDEEPTRLPSLEQPRGKERVAEGEICVTAEYSPLATARHRPVTVAFCPVDKEGVIDLNALPALLSEETTLVSIPHANGEIGAIQPIATAAKIIRTLAPGALLHIDCSQSLGKTDVSAKELDVDFITIAGHKIYAPKGVGALYVRDHRLLPLLHGGGQQDNYRGGTENVPYCVALGSVCDIISSERQAEEGPDQVTVAKKKMTGIETASIRNMRETLYVFIEAFFSALVARTGWDVCKLSCFLRVNGPLHRYIPPMKNLEDFRASLPTIHRELRVLPNTLSLSVRGAGASRITRDLRAKLCISAGTTCHNSEKLTDTLLAVGSSKDWAQGTIRVSTGRFTSLAEAKKGGNILAAYLASTEHVPVKEGFTKLFPLSSSESK